MTGRRPVSCTGSATLAERKVKPMVLSSVLMRAISLDEDEFRAAGGRSLHVKLLEGECEIGPDCPVEVTAEGSSETFAFLRDRLLAPSPPSQAA
jgi:hypothetical protein